MSSSKSGKEYSVVVKENLDLVARLIQEDLPVLCNILFSGGLISQYEHRSVSAGSSQSAYERATTLMMCVYNKIENDHSFYVKFLTALNESNLESAAERLQSSLNMTSPPILSVSLNSENVESTIISDLYKILVEGNGLHMLSDLQPDDVREFTKYARREKLIPQQVVDDLNIMHPSVLHESKCRYLMLHICDSVSLDCRLDQGSPMQRFVTLIGKYLNLELIKQSSCQSFHKLPEGLRKAKVFQYKNISEKLLDNSHLDILCGVLSNLSRRWYEIGTALCFTDYSLNEILIRIGNIAVKCLCSLLEEWLLRKYMHAKLPTLENLHAALCNNSVGLQDVAEDVNQNLAPLMKEKHTMKKASNIQIHVNSDVNLLEQESATTFLLEVEVECDNVDSFQHSWYKDGVLLDCSPSVFKNCCVLCLKMENIQVEGEYIYMCTVGEEMFRSDSIIVKVETFLCKYRLILTSRYNLQPAEEYAWPEVQQDTYINLAVVGSSIKMSNYHYRQTIRGNADDILNSCKANIEYKMAFQDIKFGNRILVVGRPGSGKTTLVHRISIDWATNTMFGQFKALLLVYLRGFHNDPDIDLRRLITCYFNKDKDVESICEYIENYEGLGVCFILDGLDEYQPDENQKSLNFIFQLIKGNVLPHAVVIVASRPAAVARYTKTVKKHIEVLGFFKEQVEEYIKSYKFRPGIIQSLTKYLEDHPNIQHMCYLPIQTAMICFLFDVCEDSLPNTETGIYKEFTKHTILRSLYRNDGSQDKAMSTLDDLEDPERSLFFEICKIAFKMTKHSKQVIQHDEVKTLIDGNKINESLGLITIDRKATVCGLQNIYSFCHLTFQEFLAAYHISTLSLEEQLHIIESCGPMQHMYIVFKFYCGIVKYEEGYSQVKRLLEVGNFEKSLQIQCCFESQQPAVCDFVVDGCWIVVDNSFSSPRDFASLGYVVMNATQNVVRMLHFNSKSLNDECAEAFLNATSGFNKTTAVPVELLSHVGMFSYDNIPDKILKACPSLLVLYCSNYKDVLYEGVCPNLEIVYTSVGDLNKNKKLCELTLPKFRKFCIHGDHEISRLIGDIDYPHFLSGYCRANSTFYNVDLQRAEVISIVYNLTSTSCCYHLREVNNHSECLCTNLSVFNCNMNDEMASLLAEGLKYNTSLEELELVANAIGDEGAVAIASSFKNGSSLCCLDLRLNRISDEGAKALMSSTEAKLLLFGNEVSDEIAGRECNENKSNLLWHFMDLNKIIGEVGLVCLTSIMKKWTLPLPIAKTLHTFVCNFENSSTCINHVASILSTFTSLKSLYLTCMSIGNADLKLISGSIYSRHITLLDLSCNKISDEGAGYLAEAIKKCTKLSELYLSRNSIKDTGAEILSDILKSSRLRILNLSHNEIKAPGALAISDLLMFSFNTLEDLDLSYNKLLDIGAICLSRGLKHCSGLKKLYLGNNYIENFGIEAIAESLKTCPKLTSLELHCNNVGDTGAVALAKLLQICPQIESLNLSDNSIGDTGTEALAKSLQTCHLLTSLNLSDNEIGDIGAHHLSICLKTCGDLEKLMLNNNLISGVGAGEVVEGVKHCNSLCTLEIGGNILLFGDIKVLAQALRNCVSLKRLYVVSKYFEVYEDTELINIRDYLPQCYVIVKLDYMRGLEPDDDFDEYRSYQEVLYDEVYDYFMEKFRK